MKQKHIFSFICLSSLFMLCACQKDNDLEKSDPTTKSIPTTGNSYVDLGLSVKWASMNVGATHPYDYGLYFAWGETTGYTADYTSYSSDSRDFGWENYKWLNDSTKTLTKYCNDSILGRVDKYTLDLEDDAAYVNWGGKWRMPTKAEQDELLAQCSWTWQAAGNANYNGVAGYKVTGTNGNSIFLPAAGYCSRQIDGLGLFGAGVYGLYWSASLCKNHQERAYDLGLNYGYVDWGYDNRCNYLPVRAVHI